MGIPVSRQGVNFILRCISFTGHRFKQGEENPDTLAATIYQNTLSLCENSFLTLTDDEQGLVQRWLGGKA